MKMFKDKEKKEEIFELNFERVEAGTSKELKVYLFNDSTGFLQDIEVSFKVPREDLEILDAPKGMNPGELVIFRVKWSPSLKLKKGLRVLFLFKAIEVFPAPPGPP